jgi:hypothetical protein
LRIGRQRGRSLAGPPSQIRSDDLQFVAREEARGLFVTPSRAGFYDDPSRSERS